MACSIAPGFVASADATSAHALYASGEHLARAVGLCSVALLQQKLDLPASAAHTVFEELSQNGVVAASKGSRVAITTQPYAASIRFKTLHTTDEKPTRLSTV